LINHEHLGGVIAMNNIHFSVQDEKEALSDIRHEKRVAMWLFRIAVIAGVYGVVATALTPANINSLTYALPGYVFMGLFLFLTILHYFTGVWSPTRELRRKLR
jgi:Ni,Fe-hydrogenase I cytochrome b subunit